MGRKREKRLREQYVRLANKNLLYITAAAADRIGNRLNVYECGDVIALVGETWGEYHLGYKSDLCKGKNLCSEQLVAFLASKYLLQVGDRLPIWWSEGDERNVLYCGKLQNFQCRFDDRFQLVELFYNKRVGTWAYIEDNRISFKLPPGAVLPRKLSLYGEYDVLALLHDDNGEYTIEGRGRKAAAIYSGHLTQYIRRWYGKDQRGVRLHGKLAPNGIYLSDREELLTGLGPHTALSRLNIGSEKNKFISLSQSKLIYCSAQAAEVLGSNCALYCYQDEILALRPERRGSIKILKNSGHARWLSLPGLYAMIKNFYPNGKKLLLVEHGDLFVLAADADLYRSTFPSPAEFQLYQGGATLLHVQKTPLHTSCPSGSLTAAIARTNKAENG